MRRLSPWRQAVAAQEGVVDGLVGHARRFVVSLQARGCSPATVATRREDLGRFLWWCLERNLARPSEITRPLVVRYQHHLAALESRKGTPLSARSQYMRMLAIQLFFSWLTRQAAVLYNPASDLELPRQTKTLPRAVLNREEVEAVMAAPDLHSPRGLRDRAILETFYSTGIRRQELAGLDLGDLDWNHGTLWVRHGKGAKDRVVPIGARALAWIDQYLTQARPILLGRHQHTALFVGRLGRPLGAAGLTVGLARYVAVVGKAGACHILRHTCATLMLEGGADVRFIQLMLGHAELTTTQVYTHVSITQLKHVHSATHPAARLPS